jgi:amidase
MDASPPDPHSQSASAARLSVPELAGLLAGHVITSAEVTATLVERIEAIDGQGPGIGSVLRLNERAVDEASALDRERHDGRNRGPLHGVPVLVKDNIDTRDLGATAGSLALAGVPATDAVVVTRLREAGAVIIGKANLSEWANFRGRPSSSGWSAAGGQTRNPFALDRSPGGSSSGSGAGVAAGLAPLALGTETDGSILCAAAACGVVGIKPTVGLISRTGIVPVASSQDTAGPLARSVADAALLLELLAAGGVDPEDPATVSRPNVIGSFRQAALSGDTSGYRVGVVRDPGYSGNHAKTEAVFEAALAALRERGAELVDPVTDIGAHVVEDELTVMCTEFKVGLDSYLASRMKATDADGPRSLDDVITFNEANSAERLDLFPQDMLIRSSETTGVDDAAYLDARAANWRRTREEGIDAVCERLNLDALIAPAMAPAWPIDHVTGDRQIGASWSQAAVAGYPSIAVPVGEVHGLPVAVAIWGRAFTEATLVRIAGALEAEIAFRPTPLFLPSVSVLG